LAGTIDRNVKMEGNEDRFTLEFLRKGKNKEGESKVYFEFIFGDEFAGFLFAFGTFFFLFFQNARNCE